MKKLLFLSSRYFWKTKIRRNIQKNKIDYVVNLAAQAGVRYSLENPDAYIKSNVIGFIMY